MKFECAYDKILPIEQLLLIQNPKNNNKHSKEQIDRLAKLIDFQGQRKAITISNRSGFICTGHGTLMAMHKLGWKEAAVDYQDFISEAQEYAHMTADNAIALWAEFDDAKFMEDIHDIDLGDIELLGLQKIPSIQVNEIEMPDLGDGSDSAVMQMTFIVPREAKQVIDDCISRAKQGIKEDGNKNGLALVKICESYVG